MAFNLLVFAVLGIDLFRSFRHPHVIGLKEALVASFVWVAFALLFNGWIYIRFGPGPALDFLTGYLLEKSLSVDNLFVFLMLFTHFNIPSFAKHAILFYGVLGAIVMRALLIWAGIALVEHMAWMLVIFGLFLIFTGVRLAFHTKEEKVEEHLLYRWLKKWFPFTDNDTGNAWIIQRKGRWMATPLLAVLILIETTDLLFALDSVPAILGITTEPFIVYTSNIFAILGLRSLFFALEGLMKAFYLLHYALAFILVFIGSKMTLADFFDLPTWVTLIVLLTSLALAVAGSLFFPSRSQA